MKTVIANADEKMQKTLNVMKAEFATIRAGRANPEVLNKITVDYYGTETPINQVAAVSVAEARILVIQPWDASLCRAIERAIQKSDLGVNPQSDGRAIRLIFPPLTEERRRTIAKDISKMGEESKVAIRSIRRDAIDKIKTMKKNGELTEDDVKDGEKKIQEITDKRCKEADAIAEAKQKDIMEV